MNRSPQRSRRRARSRKILAGVAGSAVVILGLVSVARLGEPPTGAGDAPDVTLSYFDGSTEQLGDLVGQPVVLNFWASWCPACISEMPAFGEVHRQLGDKVRFIGINMQEVSLDAAIALAERTGVGYQLAHDPDGAIFREFGGLAMPTTVFVDAGGSVVRVYSGTISSDDLTAIIEDDLLG